MLTEWERYVAAWIAIERANGADMLDDPIVAEIVPMTYGGPMTDTDSAVDPRTVKPTSYDSRADLVELATSLGLAIPRKANKETLRQLIETAQRPVTAPLVDLYGGPRDGLTWTKAQRGPWPQCLSGDAGEPIAPVAAVKMLADTTTGIYVHVTEIDNDANPVHKYVHSSMITAYRVMNGPQA